MMFFPIWTFYAVVWVGAVTICLLTPSDKNDEK